MNKNYRLGNETVNSVELKALLVSRGVKISDAIYRAFNNSARLSYNPLTCNSCILPDGTIIQLTDIAFHMSYIQSAISWDLFKQLRYLPQMKTPFSITLNNVKQAVLKFHNEDVTRVTFPEPGNFYRQKTTGGLPFLGNAVLQGKDWLSFQCLWVCDYAKSGQPCQYCFSGGEFESLAKKNKPMPRFPSPQDAAEIAKYAILQEKSANSIQITGGSTFNTRAECDLIYKYLTAITSAVPRDKISGEIVIFTTPPNNPEDVDQIFEAGADRISCSVEVWDENLARKIMPGKSRYISRKRHLRCLQYIAEKYGPGRACSNLIIGLESEESCLAGAEYLGSHGIVPVASIWIPFGRPVLNSMKAPSLNYYRNVINGLGEIYQKYQLEPPGGSGLHVCMCRDIFLNLKENSGQV